MIQINGTVLPAPTALSVRVVPRAGTAQYNALGQLVRDGMREKRTVEISWSRMAGSALAQLSQMLAAGGFFTLVYPDPLSGAREMSCHVTEQAARVWQYLEGVPAWADVKLTLEER